MKTQKEIFAAADTILAEGGSPTVATVRAKLGSGSYSTIGPALKLWRAEQAEKQPKESAPPPVPDTVTAHAKALWDEALSLARAGLQAERERLAVERREIERERQEAGELADQLEAELDEVRGQLVRLEGADRRLEVAKAEAAQALNELAHAKAREEQARAAEVAQMAAAVDAEAKAEQYRKEAERYKLAEQACQARLEAAAREMDDLRQRVREAEARALKAAEEAAELRGRLGVYTSIQEQLAGVAQQQAPTDSTPEAAPVPRQDAGEFDEVVFNCLVEAGLGQDQFAAALADANLSTLREALNDESIPPARLDRIKARVRELTDTQRGLVAKGIKTRNRRAAKFRNKDKHLAADAMINLRLAGGRFMRKTCAQLHIFDNKSHVSAERCAAFPTFPGRRVRAATRPAYPSPCRSRA